MKRKNIDIYSLVAPLMLFLFISGFVLREDRKKFFYLPIGLMSICIISEKDFNRKMKRKNLLEKIRSFQKNK